MEGMHAIVKSVDIHTVNRRNIRPRLGTRRRQIPQNREQEEEEGHQTRWLGCKTYVQDKGPAIKELRPPRRWPRRQPKNRAFSCCKREHFSHKVRVRRQGQEGDTLSRGGYTVKKGDIQSEGNIVERRKSLRGRIYQEEECLKRRVTLGRRETWDTLPSSGTVDTTNTQHKRYPHDRLRGGTEA